MANEGRFCGVLSGVATLAKFNQLTTGMSESQVTAITGACDTGSETYIAGVSGFTLTCYAADGFGNALLVFSNDQLVSKNQFGLS